MANIELFIKNLLFTGDVLTIVSVLVITDMLAAMKTYNNWRFEYQHIIIVFMNNSWLSTCWSRVWLAVQKL